MTCTSIVDDSIRVLLKLNHERVSWLSWHLGRRSCLRVSKRPVRQNNRHDGTEATLQLPRRYGHANVLRRTHSDLCSTLPRLLSSSRLTVAGTKYGTRKQHIIRNKGRRTQDSELRIATMI